MPELHLLTGAYALDALDDVERAGFERHLRDCPACELEVIELREAAAGLAIRVATPAPAYLRNRVLDDIVRTRQLSPEGRGRSGRGRSPGRERDTSRRFSARRVLAVAATVVILGGGAGVGVRAWQQEHDTARRQQVVAEQATTKAAAANARAAEIARVMTDPEHVEVVGEGSDGGTAAVVLSHGSAVFATNELPALPAGKQYQLWRIRNDTISSEGLLSLPDGTGQTIVSGIKVKDTVAVSVEPTGGSKQPTTTPVIALKVV